MPTTWIANLEELSSFARHFLVAHPKGAAVGLSGELGAGKTEFVRAMTVAICERNQVAPPRVASPSFVLHQSYPELTPPIEHFDLYRLDAVSRDMLFDIGYFEALESSRRSAGFLFVEWPEYVTDVTELCLDQILKIEIVDDKRRFTASTP